MYYAYAITNPVVRYKELLLADSLILTQQTEIKAGSKAGAYT